MPNRRESRSDVFLINREELHYVSYDVDGPKFERKNVEVSDQFGTMLIKVEKPDLCYRVNVNQGKEVGDDDDEADFDGFRKGIVVNLLDAKEKRELCVPASKVLR